MNNIYTIKDSDLLLDIKTSASYQAEGKSEYSRESSEKKYILRVRDLPNEEKPREKLLAAGPAALSIHELLAIVLGTGSKKEGVLEMSSRVLKEYGELALSEQKDALKLASELAIPEGKAMQIVACAELGRRFFKSNPTSSSIIRSAKDVFEYLQDMRSLPKEHMRGIYLNSHHKVIHDEVISIGTVNSSLIHPREVLKPAIEYGAVAIILAHNHPSGIVEPSEADIEITKQLIEAGKIVGIHLIDHVIISKNDFKSVAVDYN